MSRLSLCVFFAALCCVIVSAFAQDERESRIVKTAQGPVRGYKDPDSNIYTFFGIPYATAPTGLDRYKAPLPGPSWLTTFEADNDDILCPQPSFPVFEKLYTNKRVVENCLIANVFVPDTAETNLPVLVVVHGGGFEIGNGNLLKPMKLVRDNNIIVVTFNYRLGIHGFLCLGTEGAPGNAGMKDQVALLRWVNKNIANFGGNPNDVTITGYSAGSASVDLHMLSPLSKGLFNKVIAESGGSLAWFAVQNEPVETAKKFAKKYDVEHIDDVYALDAFFRNASFEMITAESIMNDPLGILFTPCLEVEVGQEIFLSKSPYDILSSGKYDKVPVLYGFADREGLLRLPLFEKSKNLMNEKFSDFLPNDLHFRNAIEKERVAREVKTFYFGDKDVSEDTVLSYVDFFSDVYFVYPVLRAINFHVKAGHNKVFLYEYNYVDEFTPFILSTGVKGANHCAQTHAVFDGLSFLNLTEIDNDLPDDLRKHKATMRQLWGNFIKLGEPVPEGSSLPSWPPVGAQASPHMSLGRELQLRGPLVQDRVRFWDDIYQKHFKAPQPPSAFAFLSRDEL